MIKVLHVVGARPNYMKTAPIMRAMAEIPGEFDQLLVHTGQHYDANMSKVFLEDLEMPEPDINLEVGSDSHARQTAAIMVGFEPVLTEYDPDWVLVVGDVNSTLACALVTVKLGYPIAHVEAGLRSFDCTMPEEWNRRLTDQMSDLLLTTSPEARDNLQNEGVPSDRIHFVGNVMIDTLSRLLHKAEAKWPSLKARFGLGEFALATLHRPSNVDDTDRLNCIVDALATLSKDLPVVFSVHPRTRARLSARSTAHDLRFTTPLGYLDFLALQRHAKLVITDSGGIQEETTYLGVPCLTLRPNTERPVTISQGTNRLVETTGLLKDARSALSDTGSARHRVPDLWDGRAACRIVDILRAQA